MMTTATQTADLRKSWTHSVTKWQRGDRGQWFARRSRRFASLASAMEYGQAFADEQAAVGGTKIVIVDRATGESRTIHACKQNHGANHD